MSVLFFTNSVLGGGEQTNIGIGFKAGLNRLEGDISNPPFQPCFYGQITYNLFEFLAISAEGGYSTVGGKKYPDELTEFKTIIIPYEGSLKFSFYPLGKVNPYVFLGGGGFHWNYTTGDTTEVYSEPVEPKKLKKGYDTFLKSGGGIEIALNKNHNFYFDIGATFRYSLTDVLDDVHSDLVGHTHPLNDGILDVYGGFTYYFRTSTRGDRDNDGVPDELDLKIDIKEDDDSYMDHDGKPDDIPPLVYEPATGSGDSTETNHPPVVIHAPVKRVEENSVIDIKAEIHGNQKLKTASILYRPLGYNGWKVSPLRPKGGFLYEGVIPGRYVKSPGVEYCVIAIDEAITGVGYCGLPKIPVRVEVIAKPKMWRIISGVAALIGWGGSGYLLLKNQK